MKVAKPKLLNLDALRTRLQDLVVENRADEAIDIAMSLLGSFQDKNLELTLRLAMEQRLQSGRRTEKIDPAQLSLMLHAAAASAPETLDDEETSAADEEVEEDDTGTRDEQKPRGQARRRKLPASLPRDEIVHDISAAEKRCPCCSADLVHIGDDVSEVLELVPAQFRVQRHTRRKYACPTCREGVHAPPAAPKLRDGGLAGPALMAHVVVSKYDDNIPLNRLSNIYARGGLKIPVSTLCDWVGAVAWHTQPIVARIRERVLGSHLIQTDASGLKVLNRDHPDGIVRGSMWCYVGDRKHVIFDYAPTGSGKDGPWEFLKGRTGYIQADAASVYDQLYDGQQAAAKEVGCWAHARRKFFQLTDADSRAAWPVQLIGKLYHVEKLAEERGFDADQRLQLRRERCPTVLDKLQRWLAKTVATEPPKSALHRACAYTVRQWMALTRFLEDGQLGLDNNLCELQIRSLATGRKNYLFAGSDSGAEHAAGLYSLIRTAVLHDLDVFEYLTEVLRRLADDWPNTQVDELVPDRWAAARAARETAPAA